MHMKNQSEAYRIHNSLIYKALLKIKFILTPLLMLCQPVTVQSLQKTRVLEETLFPKYGLLFLQLYTDFV